MKYLTKRQLGITAAERDALIAVMKDLRRGRWSHLVWKDEYKKGGWRGHRFSMIFSREVYHCGTVACIAGRVAEHMEVKDPRGYVMKGYSEDLETLYYPPVTIIPLDKWYQIVPEEAADAIENFLRFSVPFWEKIVEM